MTQNVIQRLKAEPSIKSAEPNGVSKPTLFPNDPAYVTGSQWDMNMMNLPTAWEITQGSSSVIVAVLDSGIRSHPDLDPNVLTTGYNFVDMNSDPTEPLYPTAEFHGTHVAGTIAAAGNNGKGVAGIAWNAKIMPIRVISPLLGSTDMVLANGILYAAGLPNSSGKVPSQRANVINMSLAGANPCSSIVQSAINSARSAGVVVVAAAGNDYQNGNPSMEPASCTGVVAVGAVDPTGAKASYSESQPYVSIVAPGGEEVEGIHAGVLSTFPVPVSGNPAYKFEQGTSMAAPHVSGVIALMLSVNPNLTPDQVKNILTSTANPLGITLLPNNDIGYGLVDAGKAVAQAAGVAIPSIPVPYPSPSLFNFQQISRPMTSTSATIINMGASTLSLSGPTSSGIYNSAGQLVQGTGLSVSLDPSCSSIAPSTSCPITYGVDPTGLPNGEYFGFVTVTVASNGGNFAIPVLFQVGAVSSPSINGSVTIQLWSIDPTTGEFVKNIASTTTDASHNYNFTFPSVPPGTYVPVAGVDVNGDGVFGDAVGEVYTTTGVTQIPVIGGQTTSGINLNVNIEQDDILSGI